MVNKIPDGTFFQIGTQLFQVTIVNKITGETIYSHESHGGSISTVEDFKILKETEEIEGTHQHFMWGHPAMVVHAHLMGEKKVKQFARDPQILEIIKDAFKETP